MKFGQLTAVRRILSVAPLCLSLGAATASADPVLYRSDDMPKISFTWSSQEPDSCIDVSEIRLLRP